MKTGLQRKVSVAAQIQTADTRKGQLNLFRICAGMNHEVMLQPALIAMVDNINSRVDIRVADSCVLLDVRNPARGVRTEQIVAVSRQFLFALRFSARIGSDQSHLHEGVGFPLAGELAPTAEAEGHGTGPQLRHVTLTTSHKIHTLGRLASIHLKGHRQIDGTAPS